MNDENEMILDSAQDADVESPEETAQGGEQSAGADVEVTAEQDSADGQEGSEGENSGSEDASEDEEFDDYDEFYHDMSDFDEADINGNFDEDDEDFEGGDTTTDPEGEDGDEGENEGEESENADDEDADGGEQTAEGEQDTTSDESDEGAEAGTDDNAGAKDQSNSSEGAGDSGAIDYASWEAQDRAAILKAHPELEGLLKGKHLSEVLDDPGLFGYMRGTAEARAKYSAVEAFEKASAKLLATRAAKVQAKQNSKQHINSSSGKAANAGQSMPPEQRRIFRDMFPDLTPAQREDLYKSVT